MANHSIARWFSYFIVGALGLGPSGCSSPSSAAHRTETAAVAVVVTTPQKGGVERTLTRPCSIHSFEYADLYAKVNGYLTQQSVDIGKKVTKGELLAVIDAPELLTKEQGATADLAKAKALVEAKKSEQKAAVAAQTEAKKKLKSDEAMVESATAKVQLRKTQYERIKGLVSEKAIEQELADEKLDALRSAQAEERVSRTTLETDRAAIEAAAAKQAVAAAQVIDAEAGVAVAEAALASAKVYVAYTRITAPFDGVITARTYHNGDFIQSSPSNGNKPLFTVARTDLMRVVVDVPDPFVPFTRPGERVEIRIDALSDKKLDGTVSRIATSEDYRSRTMRTECDLQNDKELMVNGMYGEMTLYLGKTKNELSIPSAAFAGTGKNDTRPVYVVRDGKAHCVTVRIGLDDGIRAEVLDGLKPNDQVIVEHGPGLTENSPVRIAPAQPAAAK